ncbi:hypothetical protein [Pedobacter chitinilyticus]|uniref:Uncharacterized protein n=1 Tax=Pedobacter chitinilyticus TaxID=2233776 RepID=A0A3S3SS85_9SPHI|nr:hypothetical protein [Pedobacter chitinilyticus]RWU08165.1 hypothetical protein DPV69_07225 [Pedobacter chitinilyticus]
MNEKEVFHIELEIAGKIEALRVERDLFLAAESIYEIYQGAMHLARIWPEFDKDTGQRWVSTDLIGPNVLEQIGRAIESRRA